MNSLEMLERLVAFPTVFDRPNIALIDFAADWLRRQGVEPIVLPSEDGRKANLWATIGGRQEGGGLCLSGHSDVVPVAGQHWSSEPFRLTRRGDRLYGRGTADMKAFCAVVLAAVPRIIAAPLARPIHICLTYDEEDGCKGAGKLIPEIGRRLPCPAFAIVGEPTEMRVTSGHKGMTRLRTTVTGREAHSSRPDLAVSAVMVAGRMIAHLAALAEAARANADPRSPFLPPYTTIHVGQVSGGIAPTIVARSCEFRWDIRTLPDERVEEVLEAVEEWVARHLLSEMRAIDPSTGIETQIDFSIPGLRIERESSAEAFARRLTGDEDLVCVGYGTEAGLLQEAGIDAVLCGPGSIEQAHKPDEYIALDQILDCERFLGRLIAELGKE
jgi:acetylornithine deacetylase